MTQPEALRLADVLEHKLGGAADEDIEQAAAELRRLHAENEALTAANEQFGKRQKWWNERMFVLEEQRDALVEALKVLLNNNECLTGERLARAAIAKAEGQQ